MAPQRKTGGSLPTTSLIIWSAMKRIDLRLEELADLIDEDSYNVQNWFDNGIWAGGQPTFRRLREHNVLTHAEYEEIMLLEGYTPLNVSNQFRIEYPDFTLLLHALGDESLPKELREAVQAMVDATVACVRAYRRTTQKGDQHDTADAAVQWSTNRGSVR